MGRGKELGGEKLLEAVSGTGASQEEGATSQAAPEL